MSFSFVRTCAAIMVLLPVTIDITAARAATDAQCAGKAEGYFWSSQSSSDITSCANNSKQVCNNTFSNYCFGGKVLSINIIKNCSQQICASPQPVVVPPAAQLPTRSKMLYGVNAHNAWTGPMLMYQEKEEEAVFKLLDKNNLRSYRVDIEASARGKSTLTRLVALGKKYNVAIRPMLYVNSSSEVQAYDMAKMFGKDIKIWELGNELNLKGVPYYAQHIGMMINARKGIMKAAAETGQKLQTSINVTASLNDLGLNNSFTTYPFLDKAISMGLEFDYITFHYYPSANDRKTGWMKRYFDPLKKYKKKVLLNETHCAQIYQGDDGNSAACAQTFDDIISEVKLNYSDMVIEINAYELLDNKGIVGPEGKFGLMFDLNKPKKSFDVLVRHAK